MPGVAVGTTMVVISMMTALAFIVIILLSGACRLYFRHKFDPSEHIADVAAAVGRHKAAKTRLHNVQNR